MLRSALVESTGVISYSECKIGSLLLACASRCFAFLEKHKFDLVVLRSNQQESRLSTPYDSRREKNKKQITSCSHLYLRKIPSSAKFKRRKSAVTQWCSSLITHWFNDQRSKVIVGLSFLVGWKMCLYSCILYCIFVAVAVYMYIWRWKKAASESLSGRRNILDDRFVSFNSSGSREWIKSVSINPQR